MVGHEDRPVFAEVKCKVGEKGFWMRLKADITWFPGNSPPLGGFAFAKILAFVILLSPFVASVPTKPNVVVSKLL